MKKPAKPSKPSKPGSPKTAAMLAELQKASANSRLLAGAVSDEVRREVRNKLISASAAETVTGGLVDMLRSIGSGHAADDVQATQMAAVRDLSAQAFDVAARAAAGLQSKDELRQADEADRRAKISAAKIGRKKKPNPKLSQGYEVAEALIRKYPRKSITAIWEHLASASLPETRDLPADCVPSERQLRRHLTGRK